jgi:hypothetical protein
MHAAINENGSETLIDLAIVHKEGLNRLGPGWSFIKKFEKHKDRRHAVFMLKMQADGTLAKITPKVEALWLTRSKAAPILMSNFVL